ncbi:MAG: adenylate cyclase [Saprospiraceae bacterium]|jgi:adenylate cyclase|tara:strand:+ start:53 stop:523 length:471 start_codon:yes stop_codon:yes gene_type:complete
MGIEIERKFLLKNEDWRLEVKSNTTIKQGYLNSNNKRTVRVRVRDDKGYLTIKGISVNASRQEFEYEIPISDAESLLLICEKPIIEKIRFIVLIDDKTWEIDEFDGVNKGLILAEIELESEEAIFRIPSWVGKEITLDSRYFNSNLINHPFSMFNK